MVSLPLAQTLSQLDPPVLRVQDPPRHMWMESSRERMWAPVRKTFRSARAAISAQRRSIILRSPDPALLRQNSLNRHSRVASRTDHLSTRLVTGQIGRPEAARSEERRV